MAPTPHLTSVTNGDEESAEKVQVINQSLAPRLANPVRAKRKPIFQIIGSANDYNLNLPSLPLPWAVLQRVFSLFLSRWWTFEAFRTRPSSSETYASSLALHCSYRPSGRWCVVILSRTQYWVPSVCDIPSAHLKKNETSILYLVCSNDYRVYLDRPLLRGLWCTNDTFFGYRWCIWGLHAWISQCHGLFHFKYTRCSWLHILRLLN